MVNLSSGSRYYLWREPVDMRKSFDGLQGLVTGQMGRDALSGEVFIFMNRRRDQVKMLVWDRSGFVIYYKRLERGRFELPAAAGGEHIRGQVLPWADLLLILEGVSLRSVRWRKRYARPEASAAKKQIQG
jgi:transposase